MVCNKMIKYVATDPIICKTVDLMPRKFNIYWKCCQITLGTRSIPTLNKLPADSLTRSSFSAIMKEITCWLIDITLQNVRLRSSKWITSSFSLESLQYAEKWVTTSRRLVTCRRALYKNELKWRRRETYLCNGQISRCQNNESESDVQYNIKHVQERAIQPKNRFNGKVTNKEKQMRSDGYDTSNKRRKNLDVIYRIQFLWHLTNLGK